MEKQKNCEHLDKLYIPAEIENNVQENIVCLDCHTNLPLEKETI